jgi:hypothetical protein
LADLRHGGDDRIEAGYRLGGFRLEPLSRAGESNVSAAGNGAIVDVTTPVTVSGTSVAVLGDATATGSTGTAGGSGGNGAIVGVTAPVTVCGTGVAVLGGAGAGCGTPGATAEAGAPARSGRSGVGAHWSRPLEVASASLPLSAGGGAARAVGTLKASGELASTGTELALPLLAGLLTLALGLGLTMASRRRLASAVL